MALESTETEKKGNKKVIAIAGAVAGLVLISGIAAYAHFAKTPEPEVTQENGPRAVVTAEGAVEVLDQIVASTPDVIPQYYTVIQTSDWTFTDGGASSVDSYVENSTDNTTPIYFDVFLSDTGELVYSSPVLELGAKIGGFGLDKTLESGSYECIVEYHLVDDEQNTLTTVSVAVDITVSK